jgi:prepilin-type processing-associated H-X9-DG protein
LAAAQYVQDYDETYPMAGCCLNGTVPPAPYGMLYGLAPYMSNSQVLVCPSTKAQMTVMHNWSASYGYHIWGLCRNLPTTPGARLSEIKAAASCVSLIERLDPVGCMTNTSIGFYKTATYSGGGSHGEGGNIGFADGHVKWYNFVSMPATAWASDWPEQRISCNPDYQP